MHQYGVSACSRADAFLFRHNPLLEAVEISTGGRGEPTKKEITLLSISVKSITNLFPAMIPGEGPTKDEFAARQLKSEGT